ncbi:MAG: FMN-binding protein [Bacteroidales bacterium]|nr:FMN-binding protein [Bacteroidales bacterium]
MKKKIIFISAALLMLIAPHAVTLSQSTIKTKGRVPATRMAGDTLIVNTITSGREIYGYAGPTPLEVKIVNDCIVDVQALPNLESEEYFEPAFKILKEIWTGLTVNDLKEYVPDAVTGSTYTSRALIKNMQEAMKTASGKRR